MKPVKNMGKKMENITQKNIGLCVGIARHRGVFILPTEELTEAPEKFLPLFGQMIITCCNLHEEQYYKYAALSFLFEELGDLEKAPEYKIKINDRSGKEWHFSAKRTSPRGVISQNMYIIRDRLRKKFGKNGR